MNAESFLDMVGSVEEAAEKAANDGVKITGHFVVRENGVEMEATITAEPVVAPVKTTYDGPALGETKEEAIAKAVDAVSDAIEVALFVGANRDILILTIAGQLNIPIEVSEDFSLAPGQMEALKQEAAEILKRAAERDG